MLFLLDYYLLEQCLQKAFMIIEVSYQNITTHSNTKNTMIRCYSPQPYQKPRVVWLNKKNRLLSLKSLQAICEYINQII